MDTLLLSQGVHLRNRLAVVPVGQVKPVDYFLILKLLRQYEEVPTKLLPIPKEVATPGRPLRALDWQTATLPCLIAPCSLSRESIGSADLVVGVLDASVCDKEKELETVMKARSTLQSVCPGAIRKLVVLHCSDDLMAEKEPAQAVEIELVHYPQPSTPEQIASFHTYMSEFIGARVIESAALSVWRKQESFIHNALLRPKKEVSEDWFRTLAEATEDRHTIRLGQQELTNFTRKHLLAELKKMVGDACLRAGSPLDALAHLKAATSQARSTMYIACMAASYDSRAEANLRIGGESNLPEVLICLLAASWLYRDAGQPFQEATCSLRFLRTILSTRKPHKPARRQHALHMALQGLGEPPRMPSEVLEAMPERLREEFLELINPRKKRRGGAQSPNSPSLVVEDDAGVKKGNPSSSIEIWTRLFNETLTRLTNCGRDRNLNSLTQAVILSHALAVSVEIGMSRRSKTAALEICSILSNSLEKKLRVQQSLGGEGGRSRKSEERKEGADVDAEKRATRDRRERDVDARCKLLASMGIHTLQLWNVLAPVAKVKLSSTSSSPLMSWFCNDPWGMFPTPSQSNTLNSLDHVEDWEASSLATVCLWTVWAALRIKDYHAATAAAVTLLALEVKFRGVIENVAVAAVEVESRPDEHMFRRVIPEPPACAAHGLPDAGDPAMLFEPAKQGQKPEGSMPGSGSGSGSMPGPESKTHDSSGNMTGGSKGGQATMYVGKCNLPSLLGLWYGRSSKLPEYTLEASSRWVSAFQHASPDSDASVSFLVAQALGSLVHPTSWLCKHVLKANDRTPLPYYVLEPSQWHPAAQPLTNHTLTEGLRDDSEEGLEELPAEGTVPYRLRSFRDALVKNQVLLATLNERPPLSAIGKELYTALNILCGNLSGSQHIQRLLYGRESNNIWGVTALSQGIPLPQAGVDTRIGHVSPMLAALWNALSSAAQWSESCIYSVSGTSLFAAIKVDVVCNEEALPEVAPHVLISGMGRPQLDIFPSAVSQHLQDAPEPALGSLTEEPLSPAPPPSTPPRNESFFTPSNTPSSLHSPWLASPLPSSPFKSSVISLQRSVDVNGSFFAFGIGVRHRCPSIFDPSTYGAYKPFLGLSSTGAITSLQAWPGRQWNTLQVTMSNPLPMSVEATVWVRGECVLAQPHEGESISFAECESEATTVILNPVSAAQVAVRVRVPNPPQLSSRGRVPNLSLFLVRSVAANVNGNTFVTPCDTTEDGPGVALRPVLTIPALPRCRSTLEYSNRHGLSSGCYSWDWSQAETSGEAERKQEELTETQAIVDTFTSITCESGNSWSTTFELSAIAEADGEGAASPSHDASMPQFIAATVHLRGYESRQSLQDQNAYFFDAETQNSAVLLSWSQSDGLLNTDSVEPTYLLSETSLSNPEGVIFVHSSVSRNEEGRLLVTTTFSDLSAGEIVDRRYQVLLRFHIGTVPCPHLVYSKGLGFNVAVRPPPVQAAAVELEPMPWPPILPVLKFNNDNDGEEAVLPSVTQVQLLIDNKPAHELADISVGTRPSHTEGGGLRSAAEFADIEESSKGTVPLTPSDHPELLDKAITTWPVVAFNICHAVWAHASIPVLDKDSPGEAPRGPVRLSFGRKQFTFHSRPAAAATVSVSAVIWPGWDRRGLGPAVNMSPKRPSPDDSLTEAKGNESLLTTSTAPLAASEASHFIEQLWCLSHGAAAEWVKTIDTRYRAWRSAHTGEKGKNNTPEKVQEKLEKLKPPAWLRYLGLSVESLPVNAIDLVRFHTIFPPRLHAWAILRPQYAVASASPEPLLLPFIRALPDIAKFVELIEDTMTAPPASPPVFEELLQESMVKERTLFPPPMGFPVVSFHGQEEGVITGHLLEEVHLQVQLPDIPLYTDFPLVECHLQWVRAGVASISGSDTVCYTDAEEAIVCVGPSVILCSPADLVSRPFSLGSAFPTVPGVFAPIVQLRFKHTSQEQHSPAVTVPGQLLVV